MADLVDDGKGKGTGDEPASIEIELEGGEKKTMSAEDVGNLYAQQAGATKATQTAAEVVAAAKKYNLSVEDYVSHAEGAFAIGAKLVEDGIIDEQGEIIEKKKPEPGKKITVAPKLDEQVAGLDAETIANLKTLGTVTKALEGVNERMGSLEEDQASLIRGNLQGALKTKHKELNDDDCSKIFGISMEDRKKSLWDHAKDFVVKKKVATGETRATYAKEFGIENLEEWDANKLKEQDTGGGAAMLVEGKKVMFGSRKARLGKKDADVVTPKAAMIEYMRKQKIK